MGKRRGGKKSEKARLGTDEPEAEHSGSEDEPMGEPPLVTPYTRLVEAEAQTHLGHGDADALLRNIDVQKVFDDARGIAADPFRHVEVAQCIPDYRPKNDQDRVMFSRAAMHESQIVVQCAQCKAGTLTDVIVVVSLCAPMACQSCGCTHMRPAGQSDNRACHGGARPVKGCTALAQYSASFARCYVVRSMGGHSIWCP